MSKEQLEDFRELIDFMYESLDIEDHQRFVAISESMIKDGWFKWIYRYAKEQAERVQELEYEKAYLLQLGKVMQKKINEEEQQNKRYREAREIIEQVYKESYVRNAYGYEDGFSDGLDTAINIIDEALEESE